MRRQVSPHDWISTSVSRPVTVVVVYCGLPERACRQASLLLPGCAFWRCCRPLTGFSGIGPGPCCASAAPAKKSESKSNSNLIACLLRVPLLADALVFVLRELALLDRLFPARAITLAPLAAAQLRQRRGGFPGPGVGVALLLSPPS